MRWLHIFSVQYEITEEFVRRRISTKIQKYKLNSVGFFVRPPVCKFISDPDAHFLEFCVTASQLDQQQNQLFTLQVPQHSAQHVTISLR